MSLTEDLTKAALYAAFSYQTVGDILIFPSVNPVFSNGTSLAAAPSSTNLSGISLAQYQLKQVYVFMKYAFSVATLQYVGILDNDTFKDRVKYYFLSNYKEYVMTVLPPNTVYRVPNLDELLFNVNEFGTPARRVCTITVPVLYWELL